MLPQSCARQSWNLRQCIDDIQGIEGPSTLTIHELPGLLETTVYVAGDEHGGKEGVCARSASRPQQFLTLAHLLQSNVEFGNMMTFLYLESAPDKSQTGGGVPKAGFLSEMAQQFEDCALSKCQYDPSQLHVDLVDIRDEPAYRCFKMFFLAGVLQPQHPEMSEALFNEAAVFWGKTNLVRDYLRLLCDSRHLSKDIRTLFQANGTALPQITLWVDSQAQSPLADAIAAVPRTYQKNLLSFFDANVEQVLSHVPKSGPVARAVFEVAEKALSVLMMDTNAVALLLTRLKDRSTHFIYAGDLHARTYRFFLHRLLKSRTQRLETRGRRCLVSEGSRDLDAQCGFETATDTIMGILSD